MSDIVRLHTEFISVYTPPCTVCQRSEHMHLEKDSFDRWQNGEVIQKAFPRLTEDERELLISGTHSECWDSMFVDAEYDD